MRRRSSAEAPTRGCSGSCSDRVNSRWTGGVRREVLPNGLTLLVQRDADAPAVAVVSHVRAGFFDEPDRVAGVSHVLEHMLFKGTPTRSVGAIARETKAAGGYLNASTGYTQTTYFAVLPAASLAVALDLQADALQRSVLDPEELRRELRVIMEEARRKLDTPSAVAAETLHALLFDRHRIRRWRIGTEEQLAALTHADVVAYYRSRSVPGRAIVSVGGGVDPAPPRRGVGLRPLPLRARRGDGLGGGRRRPRRGAPPGARGVRRLARRGGGRGPLARGAVPGRGAGPHPPRSEEHTSELQS